MSLIKENLSKWQADKKHAKMLMHPRFDSYLECEEIIKTFQNKKLLDWGCGVGRFYPLFKKYRIGYFGVDISKEMLDYFREDHEDLHLQTINGFTTSFKKEFDVIWCWSIFTHSDDEDVKRILKEWKRILKDDGEIYCSIIFGDVEDKNNTKCGETFWGDVHLIKYNQKYFLELVMEAGFNFKKILEVKETPAYFQTLFRLVAK